MAFDATVGLAEDLFACLMALISRLPLLSVKLVICG